MLKLVVDTGHGPGVAEIPAHAFGPMARLVMPEHASHAATALKLPEAACRATDLFAVYEPRFLHPDSQQHCPGRIAGHHGRENAHGGFDDGGEGFFHPFHLPTPM